MTAVWRSQIALILASARTGALRWITLALTLLMIGAVGLDGLPGFAELDGEVFVGWVPAQAIDFTPGLGGLVTGTALLMTLGLFWPFVTWRDDGPTRRGYHWSLPVDRRVHDLVRVAAGALVLLALATFLLALLFAVALLSGHDAGLRAVPAPAWLTWLLGPLVWYLLATLPALRSDRPGAWIVAAFVAIAWSMALGPLATGSWFERAVDAVITGPTGLAAATSSALLGQVVAEPGAPNVTECLHAMWIWLAASAGLVVLSCLFPRRR